MTITELANIIMYISIVASFFVAAAIGEKRKVGANWSIFFCVTFSFIIGIIIVLLSPKINQGDKVESYNNPKWYIIIAGILLVIIGLLFLVQLWILIEEDATAKLNILFTHKTDYGTMYRYFALSIGYLGAALYLIKDRRLLRNTDNIQPTVIEQTNTIIQKPVKPKKTKKSIMPKLFIKRIGYVLLIVIAILIITNPSTKRFKEYRGENSYSGLKRVQNWAVFSIYKDGGDKYLGIVLNFFELDN